MKVLLQDAQTRLYYGGENVWVTEVAQAVDFGAVQTAGQKAREHRLDDANVVLRYEDPQCELALNPAYCVPVLRNLQHRQSAFARAA